MDAINLGPLLCAASLSAIGLESLPLAPAAQFHHGHQNHQPRLNTIPQFNAVPQYNTVPQFDQFIYTQSQCSHGPNLADGRHSGFPAGHPIQLQQAFPAPPFQGLPSNQPANFGSNAGLIPQLQTVYGVPSQSLDVSQSSGFEIAQNAPQGLLDSYGPPASGSVNTIDTSFVHGGAPEVHAPSSSYGPPPSGDPNALDSLAHGSQKSVSAVQPNETQTASETTYNQLPGLDGAGLDIISAQRSHTVEIPVQGQLGTYSLQFQSADPLASQSNDLVTPDHQKLLSDGLLQSILSAIEQPKDNSLAEQPIITESLSNHPDVKEFVKSEAGKDTLGEVKAE